jgi:serine O-acetyltransferase
LDPTLANLVKSDLYRYTGRTDRSAFNSAYREHPGFRFTWHLRNVAWYSSRKRSLGLLPYLWHRNRYQHYRFKYGFDISPTTRIGRGFFLGHFTGIVISPASVIGANVNINQGVTLGATSRGKNPGSPTLEDRVWVGANAVIVGKITIGSEALIAPGAYVNFDVPPKAIVLGNPGKVVSHNGSAGYINNTVDEEH